MYRGLKNLAVVGRIPYCTNMANTVRNVEDGTDALCRELVSLCWQNAFYTDSKKDLSLFAENQKSLIRIGKD